MTLNFKKIKDVFFRLASVCFFAAAIAGFVKGDPMAAVWLGLGTSMCCLRTAASDEGKKESGRRTNRK